MRLLECAARAHRTRWRQVASLVSLGLCCVLLLAAPGTPESTGGPVQVVSELDYPPFALVKQNGQADGFTVELFQAVARAMQLQYTIRVGPWGEIKNAVLQGQADVLINMAYSEERAQTHDFTVPHTRLSGAIFVRKGDRRIQRLADLPGKSLLVIKGDLPHDWVLRQGWDVTLVVVDTAEEGLKRLAAGQHDAMLLARLVGTLTVRHLQLTNITIVGPPMTEVEQKFSFAVRKGNATLLATLNEGLALVIADGTFSQLYDKWFGPLGPSRGITLAELLWYAVPGLLLVLLLLAWLHVRLRRATQALQEAQQGLEQRVVARTTELQVANTALAAEITERRHAEEALEEQRAFLQQIVDMNPACIFVKDLQGRYSMVNQTLADFYGVPKDLILGKTADDFIQDPEQVRAVNQIDHYVLSSAVVVTADTVPYTSKGGVHRWFHSMRRPLFSVNGQVTHVLGVSTDITPLKDAEDAVRQLNVELEHRVQERTTELATMNRELEAFTYSVSHDLKAPLRGIDGYCRLLLEEYGRQLDQQGQRFLANIRTGTARMHELIDDLLTYSRLERRDLHPEQINLRQLLETLLAERQQELDERQVHVNLALQCSAVHADHESMQQICRNLLDNALKFTRQVASPQITVRCQATLTAWVLQMQDNGIGFDMRYHQRIFDMFQRLQREEDYPGTGVGLAIVRKAVERLGGRTWADSTPGQGTTFFVEIPYESAHPVDSASRR